MMIFMLLQIDMITLCSLSLVRADRAADTKRNVSLLDDQNHKILIIQMMKIPRGGDVVDCPTQLICISDIYVNRQIQKHCQRHNGPRV